MRPDVKIGLTVGLAVLLIFVVYYAVRGNQQPRESADQQIAATPSELSPQTRVEVDGGLDEAPGMKAAPPAGLPSGQTSPPVIPGTGTELSVVKPQYAPALAGGQPAGGLAEPGPLVSPTEPLVAPAGAPAPAVTPSVTPTSPEQQRYYVVQEGDSGFWAVAQKVYGDGTQWPLIQTANRDVDPTKLRVGQKLLVPLLASRPGPASPGVSTGPQASKTYVVGPDDTRGYWGIAEKVYGDSSKWPLIQAANRNVDPSKLHVGQKLIIPAISKEAAGPTRPASPSGSRRSQPIPNDRRPIFD